MIQFDLSRCVGCGLCAGDCAPGAITVQNGKAQLAYPINCIGCGHCIAICPRNAVSNDDPDWDEPVPAAYGVPADELLALMRSRRSCRHFKPEPISEVICRQIVDAARACPTAKNLQATRYIAVTKRIPEFLGLALEALYHVGLAQRQQTSDPGELRRAENFIRWHEQHQKDASFDPLFFHAPLLLLFVAAPENARDAAAGAAYAELLAASTGLGCLYSGYFTACAAGSTAIQSQLGLKDGEQVVRCLVLGYPNVKYQRTAPKKEPNITWL